MKCFSAVTVHITSHFSHTSPLVLHYLVETICNFLLHPAQGLKFGLHGNTEKGAIVTFHLSGCVKNMY